MADNHSTINATEEYLEKIIPIHFEQQINFDVNDEEFIRSIDTLIDIFLDDYFSDLL